MGIFASITETLKYAYETKPIDFERLNQTTLHLQTIHGREIR